MRRIYALSLLVLTATGFALSSEELYSVKLNRNPERGVTHRYRIEHNVLTCVTRSKSGKAHQKRNVKMDITVVFDVTYSGGDDNAPEKATLLIHEMNGSIGGEKISSSLIDVPVIALLGKEGISFSASDDIELDKNDNLVLQAILTPSDPHSADLTSGPDHLVAAGDHWDIDSDLMAADMNTSGLFPFNVSPSMLSGNNQLTRVTDEYLEVKGRVEIKCDEPADIPSGLGVDLRGAQGELDTKVLVPRNPTLPIKESVCTATATLEPVSNSAGIESVTATVKSSTIFLGMHQDDEKR